MDGGMRRFVEFNHSGKPPTAVLCSNDMTAIGVMREAYDQEIKIPDDLSVVGFDDIRSPSSPFHRLTTVQMSQVELAKLLSKPLLNEAQRESPSARTD